MFKIYDGREQFFQWDRDRKLIVLDGSIKEVHFCNKTDDCSLKREVYEENNLHLVDVPNILLQDNWRINVYGYDTAYTKHYAVFNVVARSKPEDYIYTEEELKEWEELEARIKVLEEKEVDLTGYATEEFVKAHTVVKPFPIKEKRIIAPVFSYYYVDLEELESGITYGLPIVPDEEKTFNTIIYYCIYCEDGSRETIYTTSSHAGITVIKTTSTITITPMFPACNEAYTVNISDKSTAEKLVVTADYNINYLDTNNKNEYTPTSMYHPATKKYVDDTVASIDIPETDLTGYATEEYVNNAIGENLVVKPLPIKEKKLYSTSSRYYVDLEELDTTTPYGLGAIPEEEKGLTALISYCIYCEDGTRKQIAMQQKNTVTSLSKTSATTYSLLAIMPVGINTEYIIDISDKSTASNVVVNTIRNRDFLAINNTAEFTPTGAYQPATKKYVDDSVSANNIITPFPVREKQPGFINYQYIDIEQLENGKTYGINVTDYDGNRTNAAICAYCSNGQRLNLLAIGADNFVHVIKSDNSYELHPSNTNTYVEVDISDKTSANTIHRNTYNNAKYLDINGDSEFIPEYDYQPATKKYIDDAIANAIAALRAELTATE